jgi:hypothetical protein
MLNATANPVNAKFNTFMNGTTNMYSSMQAPVLASKGHFYQLADGMENVTATILDHNNNVILPDPDRDDIYLGIESLSGVCVQAR